MIVLTIHCLEKNNRTEENHLADGGGVAIRVISLQALFVLQLLLC